MTSFLSILLFATGCSGDPEPDPIQPEPETVTQLPTLDIEIPERAAFLGEDEVRLRGTATAGDAALSSLISRGIEVNLEATGEFAQSISTDIGLNLLGTRLEDLAGRRAVDGRAFYWGPTNFPGDVIEDGLRIQIGPDLLDDNNDDIDDAARLVELLATDPSIGDQLIGSAIVEESAYSVIVTGLKIRSADVDIVPNDEFVSLSIQFNDFEIDFTVDAGFEVDGTAKADPLTVNMDVLLSIENGLIQSSATQANTELTDFELTIGWVPKFISDYLADWIKDYLQDAATDALKTEVSRILVEFIEGLTADIDVADVLVSSSLSDVQIHPAGIRVTADVTAEGGNLDNLPTDAGSAKTESRIPDWDSFPDKPLTVAIDDDVANQFLFSYWATGAFDLFEFSGTELALMIGTPIEAPLGPVSSASFSLKLPPMLRPARQDDMAMDLGMGELHLNVAREDGQLNHFSISSWIGTQAAISDESDTIGVALDNRPKYIPMEIGVMEWDPALDPGDLASLLRLMMPPVFGRAASLAPRFDIPAFDLGESLELEDYPDLEIGVDDVDIRMSNDNWLFLSSGVKATQ